jgi:hypothetical protein
MPPPPEALQDDIKALEALWLQTSSDSYTTAAFWKEGGLIYMECDDAKGYQACIRSPGQLACMTPELRSQWFTTPQDAQRHVVQQALQHYRKIGLLTEESEPILQIVEAVREQLRPSMMNPAAHEVSGNPIQYGGEQQVLPFSALHNVNLSLPVEWPAKMHLLRIDLAHIVADTVGTGYGILIAPDADEENSVYFGLSLEWCRGTEYHGVGRLQPQIVMWDSERWKIRGGGETEVECSQDPEELIRQYHETVLHKLLPNMRAKFAERLPAVGLLVRLIPGGPRLQEDGLFAWAEMQRVVVEEEQRRLDKLVLESIEEADVDGEVADGYHYALHRDIVAHDIFRVSCGPLTEMVVADAPFWLAPLLHRWYRLHDLELAAIKFGPVWPVLSPLVLEAVLTMPSTGMKDLAFDAYRALGCKVLGVLTAVNTHAKMPGSHHKHVLQTMVDMLPRDELARLMRNKFPMEMLATAISELDVSLWAAPGTRCHQNEKPVVLKIPNHEDLANITEAFVGAYFSSEGSFFSAWQFLLWLQQEDVQPDISETWENAVLGHLLFGSSIKFHGRTTSYLELYEIVDGSEKILRVHYTSETIKSYWIEYRRSGLNRKVPEERRVSGTETWEPLVFTQKQMIFVSKCICLETHQRCPVPNKVNSWLLGAHIAALAVVKPYTSKNNIESSTHTEFLQTPAYSQLLEKRTGELWVNYRHHGWFIYSRSDKGDIGFEQEAQASRTSTRSLGSSGLMYSEKLKTFVSRILKKPVPNRVTEWLHHNKRLAFLVTPKNCDLETSQVIDEKSDVEIKDEAFVVKWWYRDGHTTRCFQCSVDFQPLGAGGVVLTECEITDLQGPQEKKELIYSEEMKTWLSPALTKNLDRQKLWENGVPVPSRVMEWLKCKSQRAMNGPTRMSNNFRTFYFKVPWCVVPLFAKNMVPRTIDLDAVQAELLEYTFSNPMLLLEALTHSSFRQAITHPNTRLATIGRSLVETSKAQVASNILWGQSLSLEKFPDHFHREGWIDTNSLIHQGFQTNGV